MKSKLEKHSAPSCMSGGFEWEKLVLDFSELVQAIADNSVVDLVRSVLRPKWGESPMFHLIVAEQVNSVLGSVAKRLRDSNPNRYDVVSMVNATQIEKSEKWLRDKLESIKPLDHFAFWKGEL